MPELKKNLSSEKKAKRYASNIQRDKQKRPMENKGDLITNRQSCHENQYGLGKGKGCLKAGCEEKIDQGDQRNDDKDGYKNGTQIFFSLSCRCIRIVYNILLRTPSNLVVVDPLNRFNKRRPIRWGWVKNIVA